MNSYFFKMTNNERENILNQHRDVYDGFVTQYGQKNQQPLYIQDLANDKGGITVNNKGNVTTYTNVNINEVYADAGFVPDQSFDFGGPDKEFMVSMGEHKDTIGDGPDDLDYGTFEDDETEILVGPEGEFDIFVDTDDNEKEFDEFDIMDFLNDDESGDIHEQLKKTLDMFKRFKNY